MWIVHFTV
jgi:predicted RNase H-like HicB family nuclease